MVIYQVVHGGYISGSMVLFLLLHVYHTIATIHQLYDYVINKRRPIIYSITSGIMKKIQT